MTWPMSSEHLQLLVAGYVLGDLDPDEAEEFEQLLLDYPAIAQEVTQMQAALEMPYALLEVEPPAHLRSAILNAHTDQIHPASKVAQPVTLAAVRPPASRKPRRNSFPWNRALNLAAAVLIVILGTSNYRLRQTLQASQTETQRLAALNYSLTSTEVANPASATVVVNPNSLEAVLTVKNLPPLPPGKVYALWTVLKQDAPYTTDSKGAILIQAFNVDAQGSAAQPIVVPTVFRSEALVAKVAVTIEDATAPQKHQGTPIMITTL